jgi:PKD repeat protein
VLSVPTAADLITGQVVDPNAVGVQGVNIDAYDLFSGNQVTVLNDGTNANGFFSATIAPGVYRIVLKPQAPPASTLLVRELNNVVVSGTTALGTIPLTLGVALSGRVVDENGFPVAGIDVDVVDRANNQPVPLQGDHPNAFGNFVIAVPSTPIEVRFKTNNAPEFLAPLGLRLDLAGDTNLGDVTLFPGLLLSGRVLRSNGTPVVGADIDVHVSSSGDKLYTPGDNTNSAGDFEVVVPAGTYDIEVCPPPAAPLIAKEVRDVLVTADEDIGQVVLATGVILSGTIRDYLGATVQGADVDVRSTITGAAVVLCNDNSNAAGAYSVIVPNGTFDVTFSPQGGPCASGLLPDLDIGVVVSGNTVHDGVLPELPIECAPAKAGSSSAPPTGSGTASAEADFFGRPLSGPAPLTVDFHEMARGTWVRYSWSFGDGGTSTSKNPVHTYTTPGIYTVSLTVSRLAGTIVDTETKAAYVEVFAPLPITGAGTSSGQGAAAPRASARTRAGGNHACYTGTLAVSGAPWRGEVDASVLADARFTLVVGQSRPRAAELGAWLVDLQSPRVFASLLPTNGSAHGVHRFDVPRDPALLGRAVYTQAVVIGSSGQVFCNAIDLVIGH